MSSTRRLVPRGGFVLAPALSPPRLCPRPDCVHRASGHSVGVPSRGAQPFSRWPVGRKVGTPTGKRADRSSAGPSGQRIGGTYATHAHSGDERSARYDDSGVCDGNGGHRRSRWSAHQVLLKRHLPRRHLGNHPQFAIRIHRLTWLNPGRLEGPRDHRGPSGSRGAMTAEAPCSRPRLPCRCSLPSRR